MVNPENFIVSDLRLLLEGKTEHFSNEQYQQLITAGAVLFLESIATDEAIQILSLMVERSTPEISTFALEALMRLANKEHPLAIDLLYRHALKENLQGLRQWLLAKPHIPSDNSLKILLEWLVDASPQKIERLSDLTVAFFRYYSPDLQNTILLHSRNTPFHRWAKSIAIIKNLQKNDIDALTNEFNSFSDKERSVFLEALFNQAKQGNPVAYDLLINLHIHYDLSGVAEFLQAEQYIPEDARLRALYFFFTSQVEEYIQNDYQNAFLIDTYQRASKSLRYRILQQARRTGQIAWLQNLGSEKGEVRFLADLSDTEWENILKQLTQEERFDDLWKLAQRASPYWSVVILSILSEKNWQPPHPMEQEGFSELSFFAQNCAGSLPKPSLVKTIISPERQISSLAFHPQGKFLAAGSAGQTIFVWGLPEGKLLLPAPSAPYPNHRVVLFSPDGEYLVSAGGDHRIRVFRMSSLSVIKTFEGHRGQIRSMQFSTDGKSLITAGFDGSVRVWRFPMGTELYRLNFAEKEIFSIIPFSEGNLLAVAGYSPHISILSLPDLKPIYTIPACSDGNFLLAGHSSTDLLVAGGKDRILRAWNGKTGNFLWQIGPLPSQPTGLFLHPDGEHIIYGTASGNLGIILSSNPASFSQVPIQDFSFSSMTLTADGSWISGVNDAGVIHLWDNSLYLWARFIHRPGSPLPIHDLEDKISAGKILQDEMPWAKFILAFWKWESRFDIEVSEPGFISVGEFDIEI